MRLGDVHYGRIAGVVIYTVDNRSLVRCRKVGASALRAEQFLDVLYHLGDIDVLGVHFVYDDYPGLVGLRRQLECPSGVRLYSRCRGDDYQGGFRRRDCLYGRADKIRVAGGVDYVYQLASLVYVNDLQLYLK